MMLLTVKKHGEISVVALDGKMTIGDGDQDLRQRFMGLLDEGAQKIVIDMLDLAYLDSTGLGELVACKKRAAQRGANVNLAMLENGKPHELFKITLLTKVFDVYFSVEDALASYAH